jgi:hypothetical protein
MGIALIQRPLRFIGDKTNAVKMIDGKPKVVASPDFELACRFARDGYGPAVQHIARRVMHSLS